MRAKRIAGFARTVTRAARGAVRHATLSDGSGKMRWRHRIGFATLFDLFLSAHSKPANRRYYNLLQAFKNHVVIIDSIIDSPSFSGRKKKGFGLCEIKAIPELRQSANCIVKELKRTDLSPAQRKEVIKIIQNFRRRAAKAADKTMRNPFADEKEVKEGVQATTGDFIGTASNIACICYGIKGPAREESRNAFENFSNALQIKDDLKDASADFGIVQNTTVAIARKHPKEFEALRELSANGRGKNISMKWFSKNMPLTLRGAETLFHFYLAKIPNNRLGKGIKSACEDAFYSL